MTVIFCVDDRMGLAFHNRRQSRDKALCQRVLSLTGGCTLRMAPYSRPLFEPLLSEASGVCLTAGEGSLECAGPDDLCFLELEEPFPWLERADQLLLYRWNRAYPGSLYFPAQVLGTQWRLNTVLDFPGSSHDKITEEAYEKI